MQTYYNRIWYDRETFKSVVSSLYKQKVISVETFLKIIITSKL